MFFTKYLHISYVFAPLAVAQTFSACDPTKNTTCSPNPGLTATSFSSDFTTGASSNSSWKATAGNIIYGNDGAEFIINKSGDAPTMQTDFYFFFGLVEVTMKAASGTGIVSSIVLESDDLDEFDWEALGGDKTQIQSNYFGKGNTTTFDRAIYHPVTTPQDIFHTYTINWTNSSTTWAIDGKIMRTLNYADAVGGRNYPQTPMNLRLGIWAGGDSENAGTVQWAGGKPNYADAPFTMVVKSVRIENYNAGTSYKWGDQTGASQSIRIEKDSNGGNISSGAEASSSVSAVTSSPATAAAAGTPSATLISTTSVSSRLDGLSGSLWALCLVAGIGLSM